MEGVALIQDRLRSALSGFCAAKPCRVTDALEQALYARRPAHKGGLVHHSDRGSQYLSIRYTERLAKAGIEPSVGSAGDACDNALAETINGLYKTEVIRSRASWRSIDEVDLETLKWPYSDASTAYRLTGRLVQPSPTA